MNKTSIFCESATEIVSIQENYFQQSNFAEFSGIGTFSEPRVPHNKRTKFQC